MKNRRLFLIFCFQAFNISLSTVLTGGQSLSEVQKTLSIYIENQDPMLNFSLGELTSVLSDRGYSIHFTKPTKSDVILLLESSEKMFRQMKRSLGDYNFQLKPEGFSLKKDAKGKIWVAGADLPGLMYGILEFAEQFRLYGIERIRETDQNPYMLKRGIKFNIPLDVRTPSYSDMSDAGQNNIAEMWNFDFWKETIDHLAKCRYNLITIWSLHPFPSMVRVPEFPDIALNDVMRSAGKFREYYNTRTTDYGEPEITGKTETLLNITIDEKIAYWKKVMSYARERNIEIYIITWNIYTYGVNGKYGITDDMNNETTKEYFRNSIRQMFLTYPDLAGIGVTTGENMGHAGEGFEIKEDWIFDTYAKGILDVLNREPERKITFVHRQHEAGTAYIKKKFIPLSAHKNIEFIYSFKYAQAHVFSSVRQSYHTEFVRDISGSKTFWTLRNDDNYYFRWGAPDYVRIFLKNIPGDISKGFYYGSDNYIWGKDFLSLEPLIEGQTEIARQWYQWMIWGRLGYNPDLTDDFFIQIIADRFPRCDAQSLFSAWQNASTIYPVTTGFHWGDLDFRWYIEGCKSRPEPAQTESGFHDVNRFITLPPHRESGYQSIPDYVSSIVNNRTSDLLSPFQVAEMLHCHADSALKLISQIKPDNNKELTAIINDIVSMAYLGKYYAFKIEGAVNLALFRETKAVITQDYSVKALKDALYYWKLYIESAMRQYRNPIWTNRVGYVDWIKLTDEVEKDIEIAMNAR